MKRKDGKPSKRRAIRRNKAGNPITISISAAIERTCALPAKSLDTACKENLELLVEVRNNAVHFVNEDRDLAIRVHEVGVAALRNYATALADWFEHDISSLRFAILPLSFEGAGAAQVVPAAKRSQQAQNLLAHMERAIAEAPASSDGRFAVSLRVETKIVGAGAADAVPIKFGKGPRAVPVEMSDEEFIRRWPYDYRQMLNQVKKRGAKPIMNAAFHALIRELRSDERCARERLTDPRRPKTSPRKWFYSEAMVDHVARRLTASANGTTV